MTCRSWNGVGFGRVEPFTKHYIVSVRMVKVETMLIDTHRYQPSVTLWYLDPYTSNISQSSYWTDGLSEYRLELVSTLEL